MKNSGLPIVKYTAWTKVKFGLHSERWENHSQYKYPAICNMLKCFPSIRKWQMLNYKMNTYIWLGFYRRAYSMSEVSSNQPSLEACPGLMWCATGLRFWYVRNTAWASKLAIGIDHLWSWAVFKVAQIWAINFAKIQLFTAGFYEVA